MKDLQWHEQDKKKYLKLFGFVPYNFNRETVMGITQLKAKLVFYPHIAFAWSR